MNHLRENIIFFSNTKFHPGQIKSGIYGKKEHTKENQILVDSSDVQESLETLLSTERQ